MGEKKPEDSLYQAVIAEYLKTESVEKTALNLSVSQVKVRKVLITEDMWASRTSLAIQHYRNLGKTTAEIAEILHTTEKAVQQYLPYSRGLYNGDNRSADAVKSADYRLRIQEVKAHTLRKKFTTAVKEGWEEMYETSGIQYGRELEDQGELEHYVEEQYPGILDLRELPDYDFSKAKCKGQDIYRLHLELVRSGDQIYFGGNNEERLKAFIEEQRTETTRVLQAYGNVKNGDTISRDIAVPGDLPLYALHYVIQRLFGWQNYHLHHFKLSDEAFLKITEDNAGKWSNLIGVLFQSPEMADEDRYWADDYESGSFKTWLKKKYTGPYMSLNHGEGIIQSKFDVAEMKMYAPYIELKYAVGYSGEEYMYMAEAKKTDAVSKLSDGERKAGIVRKAVVPFDEAPMRAISLIFETSPYQLLERLTIEEVLAFRDRGINNKLADGEEICDTYETFMDDDLTYDIQQIMASGLDEPWKQPYVPTCTDTLYYEYDYGDGWMIRITGSTGCADLVEKGLLTQDDIDKALISIFTKYKPVCLLADGLPVLEDVGGLDGYIRFLRGINKTKEKAYWAQIAGEKGIEGDEILELIPDNWDYDDSDSLEWAKSLGWSKRVSKPENML